MRRNVPLGVTLMILGALTYAIMGLFVKLIGSNLPTSMTVFFRFLISFFIILPWLLYDKKFTLKVKRPWLMLVRIVTGALSIGSLFYAINYIPLVDANLLISTAPLFVPLAVYAFTRVKTPKSVWLATILGFVGVVLVLHPTSGAFHPAAIVVLIGGALGGVAFVSVRLLAKENSTNQILFYYFVGSSLFLAILMAFQWQMPSAIDWLYLLGVGVFGGIWQILFTVAMKIAPARLISPLYFTVVIFSGIIDWVFWQKIPSYYTVIGFIVILCGVIGTLYFGRGDKLTPEH